MAKITFGGVVADARNKLGDVVYSRNRGGAFARALVQTGVRHTAPQTAQRAAFKTAVQRWYSTLTETQRENWRAYAVRRTPTAKPIGTHRMSGQNAYVYFNASFYYLLNTFADDPPANDSIPALTNPSLIIDPGSTQMLFSVDGPTPVGNQWTQIFLSAPTSPSITNPQKRLIAVDGIFAGDPNPKDIWASYTSLLPAPAVGQKLFCTAQWYDVDGVHKGPRLNLTAIAGGNGAPVLSSVINLTSAQVKSMVATPVTLVPAPGAGYTIVPLSVTVDYKYITTAYTIPAGYQFFFGYADYAHRLASYTAVGTVDQTHNVDTTFPAATNPMGASLGVNKPLIFGGGNTATELTLGAGTLRLQVEYILMAVQV